MRRVKAAVEWDTKKAYFFEGSEYVRFDITQNRADIGWPKAIAAEWAGLWDRDIDAAVNVGGGKVYFFKGSEYVRYDMAADRVEAGWPKAIAAEWAGLWDRDIDAAVHWGNGKVYFFKGSEYVRYDMAADRVEAGWPKAIAAQWAGLWDRDIDAAVNCGNGKAIFFRGNEYIQYDIANDHADSGYPRAIPADWLNPGGGTVGPTGEATDSDGNRLHSASSWSQATTFSIKGGQAMHFQITNLNVLGTTIKLTSTLHPRPIVKESIIGPRGTIDFKFTQFGNEPMGWNFKVETNSDAFLVGWNLYSSWIPGDPPNR